jgi:putative protein-disulfide isomerase
MSGDAQLIYMMDPHCGWCYGYSGTMHSIAAHFQNEGRLELSLVTGGLFHPAKSISSDFAEDKRPIAARISQQFTVQFSEDYFRNVLGSGRLDSLVPCQVINAVKISSPEAVFAFAKQLIEAAFSDGRNISEQSVCLDVVHESGLDSERIASILPTPEVIEMTKKSFEFSRQVGTGFPSLILKSERGLTHLGGAQLDLKTLKAGVDAQLNPPGTNTE